MSRIVVTIGEALVAFIAEPGRDLADAKHFFPSIVGAESNVAVGLSRLGVPTAFIGRIGDDALGTAVLRFLRGEGVDVQYLQRDPTRPTGMLARDMGSTGVSVVYGRSDSAGARLEVADIPGDVIDGARHVHISGVTPMLSDSARAATAFALSRARDAGVSTSLDPNVRLKLGTIEEHRLVFRDLLPLADLILASRDESMQLTETDNDEDARASILAAGAKVVVIKDGDRGAMASDGETTANQRAFTAMVVDPVGAGDAFDAAFLAGWLKGDGLAACLARGALAGSVTVATAGDIAAIDRITQTPGEVSR